MRNPFKILTLMLFMLGYPLTSCTKDNVFDEQNLYEQGTEGDDENHPKERDGNQ